MEKGVGSGAIARRGLQVAMPGLDPMIGSAVAVACGTIRGKIPGGLGALLIDTDLIERVWGLGGFLGGTRDQGGL